MGWILPGIGLDLLLKHRELGLRPHSPHLHHKTGIVICKIGTGYKVINRGRVKESTVNILGVQLCVLHFRYYTILKISLTILAFRFSQGFQSNKRSNPGRRDGCPVKNQDRVWKTTVLFGENRFYSRELPPPQFQGETRRRTPVWFPASQRTPSQRPTLTAGQTQALPTWKVSHYIIKIYIYRKREQCWSYLPLKPPL